MRPALQRLARMGDGWLALSLGPEEVARCRKRLEVLMKEQGRDFSQLELAVFPGLEAVDRDALQRYCDAGATQVVVSAPALTPDAVRKSIHGLAELIGSV